MQNSCHKVTLGFLSNKCTQSTPLDPKLMFWCVSYLLGAFGTVKLPYETQGKTFWTRAKVRATKSRRSFSRRTHLIHHIGPYSHVLVCFIPFWCIWDHLVALPISEQNEVASEFFTTNAPDPSLGTINLCFGAIHTIWVHLRPFGCHRNRGAKRAELVQKFENEVALEFFASNAPDPPHWTLNWCFAAFRTIWVHLWPFGCLTKLGAKRAELVQKLVPRSCVNIFRNERTRCTPLDPKLIFWCDSYYLGAFGTVWLP